MSSDLLIGSLIALFGYLLMTSLVFYSRRIVERINEKEISHIREIRTELSKGGKGQAD